jgi:predicted DNA-binding transcriptional regulator AlpA
MTTLKLPPGITMKKLAPIFGLSMSGIYAAISNDRFPIPTYKLGKGRYADQQAVRDYFEAKRSEGLTTLASVTP